MKESDFFVIFSLSRCGSTALHRALNFHSAVSCLYEPGFDLGDAPQAALLARLDELSAHYSGIKHVWDPSGFPFGPDHASEIDDMEQHAERRISLNETLLTRPGQRVVFLRRRDALARILSDLLGQQTNIWGPRWDGGVGVDEGATYRSEVAAQSIKPIDVNLVDWYLTYVPEMERRLRRAAAVNPCLDLYYEELFDRPDQSLDVYRIILEFLRFPTEDRFFDRPSVEKLLGTNGKLNAREVFQRIPNYAEIRRRFLTSQE